jgi:hypothetical protein
MLKRQRFRHKIAIAGQVKDGIPGQGIPGATVKIIEAPDEFINSVIFQVNLFGLPNLLVQGCFLGSALNTPNESLPKQLENFRENLKNPSLKSADKLKSFQMILEDPTLSQRHKFQGLQGILDYLPFSPKGKNSHPERTQTNADGWFYFTNLPAGFYQIEASLPGSEMRYCNAQGQIEIGEEKQHPIQQEENIDLFDKIRVELELKPTTLLGKVTSGDEMEVIGMAKVQIQGSGEDTFSLSEFTKQKQGEWNYRLVGISARNTPLTVVASARGYLTNQKEISIQPGEVKSLDFQLISQ